MFSGCQVYTTISKIVPGFPAACFPGSRFQVPETQKFMRITNDMYDILRIKN
jgi:hypothetical protein